MVLSELDIRFVSIPVALLPPGYLQLSFFLSEGASYYESWQCTPPSVFLIRKVHWTLSTREQAHENARFWHRLLFRRWHGSSHRQYSPTRESNRAQLSRVAFLDNPLTLILPQSDIYPTARKVHVSLREWPRPQGLPEFSHSGNPF